MEGRAGTVGGRGSPVSVGRVGTVGGSSPVSVSRAGTG